MMLWSVLKHADRRRLEIAVAFLEPGPFEDEVRELGVPTFAVPAGRLRELWAGGAAVRRLARIIRAEQPDLILNWSAKAQLYGASAAAHVGRGDSVVWWQHGVPDGHWLDRAATALPARAVGCSSRASANAQAAAWPHRRTFVVHPGVETAQVPAIERNALGIPNGRPIIGIAGRLQPWKGQHRFLDALRRVHDAGVRAHGLIVGGSAHGFSPGYEQQVRALVRQLGLEEWVTMVGHVPDARPYIAAMDILVSASDNEPFGLVLAEALAQGVPVVAVADAGPLEIVDPGVTGLLVPRPSPPLLAASVGELLADQPRRLRMAAAARRMLLERFGISAMVETLETRLRALAADVWPRSACATRS
jgi:glycosyltransferase involved in cell wall biosynthesis